MIPNLFKILFGQDQDQDQDQGLDQDQEPAPIQDINEWFRISDHSDYPGKIVNVSDTKPNINHALDLSEICSVLTRERIMKAQD